MSIKHLSSGSEFESKIGFVGTICTVRRLMLQKRALAPVKQAQSRKYHSMKTLLQSTSLILLTATSFQTAGVTLYLGNNTNYLYTSQYGDSELDLDWWPRY